MENKLDEFILQEIKNPYSLENIKDSIRGFSYENSRYKPADIRAIINRLIKANIEVHLSEIIEIKLKIDNYKTNTPLDEFIKNIIKRNEEEESADVIKNEDREVHSSELYEFIDNIIKRNEEKKSVEAIKYEDYFHHIILSNDEKDEVIKILASYYKSFYNKRENTGIER